MLAARGASRSGMPSMKVPPKRKGNWRLALTACRTSSSLNESPSEKEGKLCMTTSKAPVMVSLNESPSEKEGKFGSSRGSPTEDVTPQ